MNQYLFRNHTVFSARNDKQGEDKQVLDETELFNNLNINHNLTESDLGENDLKSPLEHQIQQQEMKDCGWRFNKNNSMTVYFHQIGEMIGLSYVKISLRSSAIIIIEVMINIVPYGHNLLIYIFVLIYIRTEFQTIDHFLTK